MSDIARQTSFSLPGTSPAANDIRGETSTVKAVLLHWPLAILLTLWLAWAVSGARSGAVNSFETGVYVNGGNRLLQGQHVYVDFFSIYGPLTYYPFALTQLITPNPQLSSQIAFIGFALLDAILAYFVARGLTSNRLLQLLVVVSSLTYSAGGFRVPFALAAILCVTKYAGNGRLLPLVIAGAFAAVNLSMQQDMAAYVAASVGFTAVIVAAARPRLQESSDASATGRRCFAAVAAAIAGFIVVATVFMAWLAHYGSARAYVHDTFVLPLRFYDTLHMRTIPSPWSAPPLAPGVVSMWARFGIDGLIRWFFYTLPFYWVPAVCAATALAATFVLLRRKLPVHDLKWWGSMLIVAAIGLCMSRSILKTGDEIKLKFNSLPAAILMVAIAGRLSLAPIDRAAGQPLFCGLVLAIFEVYPILQSEIKGQLHPMTSPVTSLAASNTTGITPLDIQCAGSADVARIAAYLRGQPSGSRLFCVPSVPILYIITGMNNATSYDYLDPIIAPEVSAPLVSQLRQVKPEFVVVYDGLRFWDQYEFGKEFGRDVAAYIDTRYTDVFRAGNYRVLRRKPESLTSGSSNDVRSFSPAFRRRFVVMSESDIAVSVRNLSKLYTIAHDHEKHITLAETMLTRLRNPLRRAKTETFWALKDIDFDVKKGDVVGIIGRNGAGKSTLLKILSRITEPTTGQIDLYGRVGSLLEVGTGFHPELTGRENVFLNGAILGMSKAEIKKQFDAIVDFAGVEKFLDTPVKRYSSGMYVRLAFAVAAHLESEILIVDEVLAVGDTEFQRRCLGKMKDVASGGRTVLFVSHQMQSVQVLCNRAMCLSRGSITYFGSVAGAIDEYVGSFAKPVTAYQDPDRRPGTGEFRFLSVVPVKESFACGEEKVIDFTLERKLPFAGKYFVSALIVNENGATIAQCDSRLVGFWLDGGDRQQGRLSFRSPWLRPGRYRFDLFLCNSGIIDRLEDACSLEVLPLLPYTAAGNDEATAFGAVFADFAYQLA